MYGPTPKVTVISVGITLSLGIEIPDEEVVKGPLV